MQLIAAFYAATKFLVYSYLLLTNIEAGAWLIRWKWGWVKKGVSCFSERYFRRLQRQTKVSNLGREGTDIKILETLSLCNSGIETYYSVWKSDSRPLYYVHRLRDKGGGWNLSCIFAFLFVRINGWISVLFEAKITCSISRGQSYFQGRKSPRRKIITMDINSLQTA